MKMTKELFMGGQLFTTIKDVEYNRKHTYRYIESGRIDRYFIGMQDKEFTERFCMVDTIKDDGFNAWVELFNKYYERKILFEDLIIIEEK